MFLAIAVDNLANAQELTKVEDIVTTCSWQIMTAGGGGMWGRTESELLLGMGALGAFPGAMPSLIKTVYSPEGKGDGKVATEDR